MNFFKSAPKFHNTTTFCIGWLLGEKWNNWLVSSCVRKKSRVKLNDPAGEHDSKPNFRNNFGNVIFRCLYGKLASWGIFLKYFRYYFPYFKHCSAQLFKFSFSLKVKLNIYDIFCLFIINFSQIHFLNLLRCKHPTVQRLPNQGKRCFLVSKVFLIIRFIL